MNITKEEYQKATQQRRIVFAGRKYTKDGWTHFMPYIVPLHGNEDGTELKLVIVEESSYWNKKTHDYQCNAWGSNRVLEVFLSIGYALGL